MIFLYKIRLEFL